MQDCEVTVSQHAQVQGTTYSAYARPIAALALQSPWEVSCWEVSL